MPNIGEKLDWFSQLNNNEPYVRLEQNADGIGETCKRARALLELIKLDRGLPGNNIVDMIRELHSLDQEAVSWRQRSQWSFTRLAISERPDLYPAARGITNTIQLHSDVWMAYEWNYHRTARIIFLEQLVECSRAALKIPDLQKIEEQTLKDTMTKCIWKIQWLADEILATVPQSFGDVNHMGLLHDSRNGPPRCRAIGGYLLLWPVRTVKAEGFSTRQEQKECAGRVFERIREYTGMRDLLGDKSIV